MSRTQKIVCAAMGLHAFVAGVIFLAGYLHGLAYGAEAENAAWPFISVMAVFLVDFPVAYIVKILGADSYAIIFMWIGGTVMWGGIAWAWVKVYRKIFKNKTDGVEISPDSHRDNL